MGWHNDVSSPVPDLIQELAKRAKPLTETTECLPGVIYRFGRVVTDTNTPKHDYLSSQVIFLIARVGT
jgi:hypothetical protein